MHSTGGKIIYLRLPSEQVCIFSIILIWLVSKSNWFFIISVLKVLNIRGPIVVEEETKKSLSIPLNIMGATNNFDRASVILYFYRTRELPAYKCLFEATRKKNTQFNIEIIRVYPDL